LGYCQRVFRERGLGTGGEGSRDLIRESTGGEETKFDKVLNSPVVWNALRVSVGGAEGRQEEGSPRILILKEGERTVYHRHGWGGRRGKESGTRKRTTSSQMTRSHKLRRGGMKANISKTQKRRRSSSPSKKLEQEGFPCRRRMKVEEGGKGERPN